MQYDIIRAWKDEEYMSQEIEHPVGYAELSDNDLELLSGRGDGAPYAGNSIKEGGKVDNENINNFSFKKKTNNGLLIIDLTLVDFSCNIFDNVYF